MAGMLLLGLGALLSLILTHSGYLSPRIHHNIKKLLSARARAEKLAETLASFTDATSSVVLIDGDNVRGKTSFSVNKMQLIHDLKLLQERCHLTDNCKLYYDHGNQQEAFLLQQGLALVFSGTVTADDVIVRDIGWYLKEYKSSVLVVTADSGLKARCHRVYKAASKQLKIIDSTMFLELMHFLREDAYKSPVCEARDAQEEEEKTEQRHLPDLAATDEDTDTPVQEIVSLSKESDVTDVTEMAGVSREDWEAIKLELRLKNQIQSLQRLGAIRSGGRKRRTSIKKRLLELEHRLRVCLQRKAALGDSVQNIEGVLDQLVAKAGSCSGKEETWQRCITAEKLRRQVLSSHFLPSNPEGVHSSQMMGVNIRLGAPEGDPSYLIRAPDAATAKHKPVWRYVVEANRNYSRTDFGLLCEADAALRARALREMALDSPLYELAPQHEQQQQQQDEGGHHHQVTSSTAGRAAGADIFEPPAVATLPTEGSINLSSGGEYLQGLRVPEPFSKNVSEFGVRYSHDACGSRLFNLSLSGRPIGQSVEPAERVARLVCISDTHGMERKLDSHIPGGDILIHAGDYVGGKNRPSKHQGGGRSRHSKKRSRGLDEWLSRQPHAVKVVVRGNHDPLHGEFPLSGALHATGYTEVHLERADIAASSSSSPSSQSLSLSSSEVVMSNRLHRGRKRGSPDAEEARPPLVVVDYQQTSNRLHKGGIKTSFATAGAAARALAMRHRALEARRRHRRGQRLILGLLPHRCREVPGVSDVIVSHVPPLGVLDETCYKQKKGGCADLMAAAALRFGRRGGAVRPRGALYDDDEGQEEEDKAVVPVAWIMGHIHEGYSSKVMHWGDAEEEGGDSNGAQTLAINVANANPGRAHSIVNLATIIDLYA